jgi:hypothetical protein
LIPLLLKLYRKAIGIAALLLLHLVLGISAAWLKTQTGDEGLHLTGGVSYWARNDYRVQPENGLLPQRWCGLPVWLMGYSLPATDSATWRESRQWDFTYEFMYTQGNDVDRMLFLGRVMTAMLSIALGWLIYCWSHELFGNMAGFVGLFVFALSPTLLTHGFLITSDLSAALFFLFSIQRLWKVLHAVNFRNVILASIAVAGLCLSKYSFVIIIPVATLLVVIRLSSRKPLSVFWKQAFEVRHRGLQLGIFALIAVWVSLFVVFSIWGGYGFRYLAKPPGADEANPSLQWESVHSKSDLINGVLGFAREYHALPEAYLYGFAHVLRFAESRSAFLNGEFRMYGWVEFFPYCFATKTPPAFIALLFLAAFALLFSPIRKSRNQNPDQTKEGVDRLNGWAYESSPLLVLIGVYGLFALTSKLNIGHRHLLPIYPPLMILTSSAALWFAKVGSPSSTGPSDEEVPTIELRAQMKNLWRLAGRVAVCILLLLHAVDTLKTWPHYLAYFNFVAGGPKHAFRHLVDSSLDWSQDLKIAKKWLDDHPDDSADPEKVFFSFFGSPPPSYYGMRCRLLPCFPGFPPVNPGAPLKPGTYLISATMLSGAALPLPGRWNKVYEQEYQNYAKLVALHDELSKSEQGKKQLEASQSQGTNWDEIFRVFEVIRFARLASYLRSQEPEDSIGWSILVFRLDAFDLNQALHGQPTELLDIPEPEIETRRRQK